MCKLAFSVREAAEALGVSEKTVARQIAVGNIGVKFFGRRKLIPKSEIENWLDSLPDEK